MMNVIRKCRVRSFKDVSILILFIVTNLLHCCPVGGAINPSKPITIEIQTDDKKLCKRVNKILSMSVDGHVYSLKVAKFLVDKEDQIRKLCGFDKERIDALYDSKIFDFKGTTIKDSIDNLMMQVNYLRSGTFVDDPDALDKALEESTELVWLIRQNFPRKVPKAYKHFTNIVNAPFVRTYVLMKLVYPDMIEACNKFYAGDPDVTENICAMKLAIFKSLLDPADDGDLWADYHDKNNPQELLPILKSKSRKKRLSLLWNRLEDAIIFKKDSPYGEVNENTMLKMAQDYIDFKYKYGWEEGEPQSPELFIRSILSPEEGNNLVIKLKAMLETAILRYKFHPKEADSDEKLKNCIKHYQRMLSYRGVIDPVFDRILTVEDAVNWEFWQEAATIGYGIESEQLTNQNLQELILNLHIPSENLSSRFHNILAVQSSLKQFRKSNNRQGAQRVCEEFIHSYLITELGRRLMREHDIFHKITADELFKKFERQCGIDLSNRKSHKEMREYFHGSPYIQLRELTFELKSIFENDVMDLSPYVVDEPITILIDSKFTLLQVLFSKYRHQFPLMAKKLGAFLNRFAVDSNDPSKYNYDILKSCFAVESSHNFEILMKYVENLEELAKIVESLKDLDKFKNQREVDIAHAKGVCLSLKLRVVEMNIHPCLLHRRRPLLPMPPRKWYTPISNAEWYQGDTSKKRLQMFLPPIKNVDLSSSILILKDSFAEKVWLGKGRFQLILWSIFSERPFTQCNSVEDYNNLPENVRYMIPAYKGVNIKVPEWILTYLADHQHTLYWDNDPIHMMLWVWRAQKALYTYERDEEDEDNTLYMDLFARYVYFQRRAHNPTGFVEGKSLSKRDHLDVLLYQMLFTPLVTEAIDDINSEVPLKPRLLTLFLNCSAFPQRIPLYDNVYPGPPAALLINISQRLEEAIDKFYYPADYLNRDNWLRYWNQQILFGFPAQAMLPLVEQWIFDHRGEICNDSRMMNNLLAYALQNQSVLIYDQIQRWCPGIISEVPRIYRRCDETEKDSEFCSHLSSKPHRINLIGDGFGVVESISSEERPTNSVLTKFHRSVQSLFSKMVQNWRWLRMRLEFVYFLRGRQESTIDAGGVTIAAKRFMGQVLSRPRALLINKDGQKCISNVASADAIKMWIIYLIWTTYHQSGTGHFFDEFIAKMLFSPDPLAYGTRLNAPIVKPSKDENDPLNQMLYHIFFDIGSSTTFAGRDWYIANYTTFLKDKSLESLELPDYMCQLFEIAPNGFKRYLMLSSMNSNFIQDLLHDHWGIDLKEDDLGSLLAPPWATKLVIDTLNIHMRYGLLNARHIFLEILHRMTPSNSQFVNDPNKILAHFKQRPYELEEFLQDVVYSDNFNLTFYYVIPGKTYKQLSFKDISAPNGQKGIRAIFEYFIRNDLLEDEDCKGLEEGKLIDPEEIRRCQERRQKRIDLLIEFVGGSTIRNHKEGDRILNIKQARSYDEFKKAMLNTLKIYKENSESFGNE